MKPPKCRNCGVVEWRHVCAGAISSPTPLRVTLPDVNNKVVVDTASGGTRAVVDARTRDRHRKTLQRREYLRLKQRESRARRRAAGAAT